VHAELKKLLVTKEEMVTDLEILVYCHTNDLDKFDKMLKDSDKQLKCMQQIKSMTKEKDLRGKGTQQAEGRCTDNRYMVDSLKRGS